MDKLTIGNILSYNCICQNSVVATDDETLMSEGSTELNQASSKFIEFIENSPYDSAGQKVLMDCPKCGLNFLTSLYIGDNMNQVFTCSCGFIATLAEYQKIMFNKTAPVNRSEIK